MEIQLLLLGLRPWFVLVAAAVVAAVAATGPLRQVVPVAVAVKSLLTVAVAPRKFP